MADLIIITNPFVCEPPIFTSVTYTGTNWIFNLNWTSQGAYYATILPNIAMNVTLDIFDPATNTTIYSNVIDNNAPFDASNYMVNVLDYFVGSISKYRITFIITLVGTQCNQSDSVVFPEDTLN